MFLNKSIAPYLQPGCRVHLVGIGGVSMRPLGLVLKGMGVCVTGSDMNASASTRELEEAGIPVAIGVASHHLKGIDDHQRGIRMFPDEVGDLSHQPFCQ